MNPPTRPYLASILLALTATFMPSAQRAEDRVEPPAPLRVVLFTSVGESTVRPVVAPFEERTGLTVEITRVPRRTGAGAAELVEQFTAAEGDVWWCQETLTTDGLKRAGAFARLTPAPAGADGIDARFHDSDGTWFGFAARARILMVNTALVPPDERPRSMWDLLAPRWKGKVVFAKPANGTTLFHLLALEDELGAAAAEHFVDGLLRNDCIVAPSDGGLAAMIGAGEALVGMTDTSDCRGVETKGMPVAAIYPDQDGVGTLVIPHTLALLASSGNPTGARALIEYLLSPRAEALLAQQDRGQLPLHRGVEHPASVRAPAEFRVMDVDLTRAAALADTVGARWLARFATDERRIGKIVVDFETMRRGAAPVGMTVAQTGEGATGVWTVNDDPTSHGGGRVVTQTDTADLGHRFPLCIYDAVSARDVSVSVCFKTMAGDSDRAAGLCVRYADPGNYYCCRVNSLEDNFRFYKVVGGRRIELGGVDRVPIMEEVWQSMRLEARGNHFSIWLNGAPVFAVDDDTFQGAGKVGLWLKGDSITSFDDLTIATPGERRAADFEQDDPGAAPRGLEAGSTTDAVVAWRVVNGAVGGGRCVTPDAATGQEGTRGGAVLLDAATDARDVSVSARFKVATTGPGMHLAGLVARYRGSDDHYYLRVNPKECNLRLYRIAGGQRKLVGERHHATWDEHEWHTARLTAVGARLEVLIDGKLQIAAYDDCLLAPGKAGLWATPGGDTRYDEVTVDVFD